MKRNRWLVPLSSAVLMATLVVIGWFGWKMLTEESTPSTSVSISAPVMMKYYSSINEMSDDSDIVVLGTVRGVAETGLDRGGEGIGTPIPYTVYEVEVLEVLKGEVDDSIYVVRRPPEVFPNEPLTRLNDGEIIVMYLAERRSEVVAPTITVTDIFYVPLAFDNAMLDILSPSDVGPVGRVNDDAIVVPRSTGSEMFAAETTFTMSEIRDAIGAGSDESGPVGNVNN